MRAKLPAEVAACTPELVAQRQSWSVDIRISNRNQKRSGIIIVRFIVRKRQNQPKTSDHEKGSGHCQSIEGKLEFLICSNGFSALVLRSPDDMLAYLRAPSQGKVVRHIVLPGKCFWQNSKFGFSKWMLS